MRKYKMQLSKSSPFSWIILIIFIASCANAAKSKVLINKCCRFGDHLTSEKTCVAGGGFEKWAPKVYLPLKGGFFNKTGELPAFMKAEEDSFPKTCTEYLFIEGFNKVIITNNGSLYINAKAVIIPPEDYCVEKDAALVCLPSLNLTDPESLTETRQVTKVNKCCGPRQAYNDHDSTPCVNLDKNHELYSAKIIQEANVEISYSFPECETNSYAIAGEFIATNFDLNTGDLTTESGKLFKSHQFCLDNMLGDVHGMHIFTCSEHYKEVEVQTPSNKTQDSRFFVYSIGLIISVVFLLATLAVGFLVQSNHHLLHWRCQTNYVCCLLIGDLLLATTQIAGESISRLPCKLIATSMHFFFLAAFFWLNAMCINIWWTFRDFRPSSLDKGQERFRLRIYEIYAWGLPIVFSGVAVILDNLPVGSNETVLRPRFGENKCWFYGDLEILTYFYGPIGILLCVNILLFLSTARQLTCGLWKRDDMKSSSERAALGRVCMKLVIVMGVTWIADIVSWAVGGPNYFWYFTDIVNALQGVLIFIVVGCQPQVWTSIKRLCNGRPLINTTNGPQHSSSSQGLPSMDASVTNNTFTNTSVSKVKMETVC